MRERAPARYVNMTELWVGRVRIDAIGWCNIN